MFAKELTKIQESESKADDILKKAKLDSKQALEDAKAEAAKMVEDAKTKAKEVYDAFLKDGQVESDQQYDSYLTKTKEDCAVMIKTASKNQKKAIAFIAERIVGASVNH